MRRRTSGMLATGMIILVALVGCTTRAGTAVPTTAAVLTAKTGATPTAGNEDLEPAVTNAVGAPPNPPPSTFPSSTGAPDNGPTVRIMAAGDIACDPKTTGFNGGLGDQDVCQEKATSDIVQAFHPAAVLALGDIQYVHGTVANYMKSYNPTWGRFKAITYPTIGNHEGGEGGSNKIYFQYFGARAGDPTKGYYSFDLGKWHIVSLNTNCGFYIFNGSHQGCVEGSPQEVWLKKDLAAHPTQCTMAIFHVPRFASGGGHYSDASLDQTSTALWDDLYAAGVDVVLNGHAHFYERFAPLTPNGVIDQARGIREFVVGTGGDDHRPFQQPTIVGSEYQNNTSFGVLKMELSAASYSWQFVSTLGGDDTDHGSADCHQ